VVWSANGGSSFGVVITAWLELAGATVVARMHRAYRLLNRNSVQRDVAETGSLSCSAMGDIGAVCCP
jgi:hypothetical protein